MKKSIVVLLFALLLLFSGCEKTSDSVEQPPEGILADKKTYRTYREDGEIWLEFKENYVREEPLGLISNSITFRSVDEMVLAFETGALSSSELTKVDLFHLPPDGNQHRAVKVVPKTLYEPILPEGIEVSGYTFDWEGGDSYTYNFLGSHSLYISFFTRDAWNDYLDRNKKDIDYKITRGVREFSVDADTDSTMINIYVEDKSLECYYVVITSYSLSEEEIKQFGAVQLEKISQEEFYQAVHMRYVAESSQAIAKTVLYSICSVLILCLILFLILLLLRRRKEAKAALGASGGAEPLEEPPESPEPSKETPESPGPDSEDPSGPGAEDPSEDPE